MNFEELNLVESQCIHREGFIYGIAYSISFLYQNYQLEAATNLLKDSELSIDDFKNANVASFDIENINKILNRN